MIYLSSFKLSDRSIKNPNIYPYNVFHRKDIDPFIFAPITVLYGNNGSGKSIILNIIANKLMLMHLGDSLKTADLSRVRISCMKLKKYSKNRSFLMVWNMII